MTLTELLVSELPVNTLLEQLSEYIGDRQAQMLKEIVLVNNLEDKEVRDLIRQYLGE